MGFWGSFFTAVAGAAEVAGGALIEAGTFGGGTPLAVALIAGGAETLGKGIYGMVAGDGSKQQKENTMSRDSIKPWNVLYGTSIIEPTLIYYNTWGSNNQELDLVAIIACHPCASIEKVFFDRQMVQLNTTYIPTNAKVGSAMARQPDPGSGTSFTPLNNGQTPYNIGSISRTSQGLVTVTLASGQAVPYLTAGDTITIRNITGDYSLNGTFQVAQILAQSSPGYTTTFTYLCGGSASAVTGQGQAVTNWAPTGLNAYVEYMGTSTPQTLGQTFCGLQYGTPWQGTSNLVNLASVHQAGGTDQTNQPGGIWNSNCSLVGFTAVFLRLTNSSFFRNGTLPSISFLVKGKSNIYNPDPSATHGGIAPLSYGYTANAAMCIYDYLSNSTFGYGAAYGTEIPLSSFIAAANVCDTQISLSRGGTENQYEVNGEFKLSENRGSILTDLLTACGGRLTYTNGQYILQPAQWVTPITPAYDLYQHSIDAPEWHVGVPIHELVNGVNGSYVSADNGYQSSAIPAYLQDTEHGYAPGHGSYFDINLNEDGNQRRWLNLDFKFTTSSSMVQRLSKVQMLRRRWSANPSYPGMQGRSSGTFICDLSAYQFVPTDVLTVNYSPFGWTNKQVEVTGVRLTDKLHVELALIETSSDTYAWSVAEELNPQGLVQATFNTTSVIETVPNPWSPGWTYPAYGDALEGSAASFGIQPSYGIDASGNPTAGIILSGNAPINALDYDISGPLISCTTSGSGSSLATGNYVVALSARNTSGSTYSNSDYLDLGHVYVTAGQTITVAITWAPGNAGGDLYIAQWNDTGSYQWHHNQVVSSGATSATITAFDQTTAGGPDTVFDHLSTTYQQIVHAGSFAQQVASRTATTITLNGSGMTTNQWAGYTLSLMAKYDPTLPIPMLNMPIASSTASSSGQFILTIGTNSLGHPLPDLTTLVAVFDLVVMRFKPTFTATTFTDANIVNGYYPSGVTGDACEGMVAVVLSGVDQGDMVTVKAATSSTQFTLASPWAITPNTGDIVIICNPAKAPELVGASMSVDNSSIGGVVASPTIPNIAGGQWLFTVRTEDVNGNRCTDTLAPVRECYLFGNGTTRTVSASTTQLYTDGQINVNSTAGAVVISLLPQATITGQVLNVMKISSDSHTVTITCYSGDTFGDGSTSIVMTAQGDNRQLNF